MATELSLKFKEMSWEDFRETLSVPSLLSIDEIIDAIAVLETRIEKAEFERVRSEHNYKQLDALDKVVLANNMPGPGGKDKMSIKDRENEALVSPNYELHLEGKSEAYKEYLKALVTVQTLRMKRDSLRDYMIKK